jgi:hypothetical protein
MLVIVRVMKLRMWSFLVKKEGRAGAGVNGATAVISTR